MSIKISILIPSYNSIKYIKEALKSAVNQTFKDIEILCIDANSNDGTLEFLKEEQRKDERIRIILSDKKSLGYQLNLGFKEAKGEYLTIIESDDYARLDMCEKLYELALKYNCDIIKSDIMHFTRREKQYKVISYEANLYNKILKEQDKIELIQHSLIAYQGAIYKLDFIRKFKIKANESDGASFQDTGVFFITLSLADSIYLHNEALYFYRKDNENSSIHSKEKIYCVCDEYDFIYNFLNKCDKKLMKKLFAVFLYKKFKAYWWNLKRIDNKFKLDFIKRFALEFEPVIDKLDKNFFTNGEIRELKEIIKDPENFYKRYKSPFFKLRKKGARLKRKIKSLFKNDK